MSGKLSGVARADGSPLPSLRVSRQHVRRQQHSVVRVGGYASRSHTLHSMPLLVLPRAAATRGQVLLTDQGGIALFYAGICAQFRLCLHSVRRRARSTSPIERAWPPGYALVVVFFAPCVLPLHAAASAPLLFVVVPLGVDVRTARFVVSASRALSLPGIDAVRLPLIVLALGVQPLAVVSAPRARPLLRVGTWNSRDRETVSGTDFGDRMSVVADSSRNPLSTRSMWRATGADGAGFARRY